MVSLNRCAREVARWGSPAVGDGDVEPTQGFRGRFDECSSTSSVGDVAHQRHATLPDTCRSLLDPTFVAATDGNTSALGRKRRSGRVSQSTRCSCNRCATTLQSKIHETRLSLAPCSPGENREGRRTGWTDAVQRRRRNRRLLRAIFSETSDEN